MNTPATLTGERCPNCEAPEFLTPGYLVVTDDGRKYFTVQYVIEHDVHCRDIDDSTTEVRQPDAWYLQAPSTERVKR